MSANKTTLSSLDISRLEALLYREENRGACPAHPVALLEEKLCLADERSPRDMPAHVVTMNSRVVLVDLERNETIERTLAFPRAGGLAASEVSVLTPVGAQLLGAAPGYLIGDATSGRGSRFRVQEIVYQPESSGRYDL